MRAVDSVTLSAAVPYREEKGGKKVTLGASCAFPVPGHESAAVILVHGSGASAARLTLGARANAIGVAASSLTRSSGVALFRRWGPVAAQLACDDSRLLSSARAPRRCIRALTHTHRDHGLLKGRLLGHLHERFRKMYAPKALTFRHIGLYTPATSNTRRRQTTGKPIRLFHASPTISRIGPADLRDAERRVPTYSYRLADAHHAYDNRDPSAQSLPANQTTRNWHAQENESGASSTSRLGALRSLRSCVEKGPHVGYTRLPTSDAPQVREFLKTVFKLS